VRRRRGRHQVQVPVVWLTVAHATLVLTVIGEARQERYKRAATGWCPACQFASSGTCQAHTADLAEVDALGEVAKGIRLQLPEGSAT